MSSEKHSLTLKINRMCVPVTDLIEYKKDEIDEDCHTEG